uniref:Uncharacterized protein n=1 Tax=Jaculus jaculus TaxID=51337 RepID=A0A8C5KWH9_JACJA
YVALKYSMFGPKGKEEVKIIDYQMHTFRLMPHLATVLALTFTNRYAGSLLDVFHGEDLVNIHSLKALVAGLKAYSTWENTSCLQYCRERTGGMGYMMENQVSVLKCDTDVLTTFEGDNVVRLQVRFRKCLFTLNSVIFQFNLLKDWAASASDRLRTSFLAFNMDMISNLTFQLRAVHFLYVSDEMLLSRIYEKLFQCNNVVTKKEELLSAWNSCLYHIVSLSLAHIQRVTFEQFSLAVRHCPDPQAQALLMKFCLLYGTSLVFQEQAWYLEHKYPSLALLDLCESVKDGALKVISAFNIPRTNIHTPIAEIPNPRPPWAFYAAPEQLQLTGEGARSPRPKL